MQPPGGAAVKPQAFFPDAKAVGCIMLQLQWVIEECML
jgi:hypothetical protein